MLHDTYTLMLRTMRQFLALAMENEDELVVVKSKHDDIPLWTYLISTRQKYMWGVLIDYLCAY